MSRFLADVAGSDAFGLAVILGGIGVVVGVLFWLLAGRERPPPVGGALFAAAALGALSVEFQLPTTVVLGTAALAVGGFIGRTPWDRTIACLPGAYLIIGIGEFRGAPPVVALTIAVAVAAALVADFGHAGRDRGTGMPLLAVTTVGVIITVPDTELAMALVGAALPLALLGPPLRAVSLGPAGAAAVGVIGWVAAGAWAGRPGATVGAIASLGLLLAEPVGRRFARRRPTAMSLLMHGGAKATLSVVVIHGTIVVGVSRIAGLLDGALPALIVATVFLGIGAVLSAAPTRAPTPPVDP
jgi:hypothetical protein